MSAAPGRPQRADYLASVADTDGHAAACGTCRAGGVCGTADLLMEREYRDHEDLRTVDPLAARAVDRATWPTEG